MHRSNILVGELSSDLEIIHRLSSRDDAAESFLRPCPSCIDWQGIVFQEAFNWHVARREVLLLAADSALLKIGSLKYA
jgi:hypothetical protein